MVISLSDLVRHLFMTHDDPKDPDGFLDRRSDGLQSYLEALANQVQTLAQDSVLEEFLAMHRVAVCNWERISLMMTLPESWKDRS